VTGKITLIFTQSFNFKQSLFREFKRQIYANENSEPILEDMINNLNILLNIWAELEKFYRKKIRNINSLLSHLCFGKERLSQHGSA
jgi:hypothetical protein